MPKLEPAPGPTRPTDALLGERLHRFAHDVKNRIGTALAATRMLREGPPDGARAEVAEYAERGLFDALRAVETLLDDLGVQRGSINPACERVDLREVIHEAVGDAGARTERKLQTVNCHLPGILPVSVDRELIRQVLFALLTNASKFSHPGASIRVEAEPLADHAVVRVIDHGVGLGEEDLQRIFTRYAWLGSRSTAGEAQDRGSLARVRQWVLAHRGTLEAHSDGPGEGCTFTLRLPLAA